MRKALCTIAMCLALGAVAHSQTCSPFMGIGTYQAFDNNGNLATNAVIYSFQAGTSVQQATFSDSACSVPNVNPITLGTGARVAIWLTTANTYKFVLCLQNDGSSCAAPDVLFSVDQVPGGVTGGGGGGGAPFISNAANPATSGILRLASGDSVCWRNVANSANLCFKKDTNDLLSWDGGSFKLPEVAAPTSIAGFDILYADSTAHRYKQCSNGSACAQVVNAGNDIDTTDAVKDLHFGSSQTPLSSTAPTTGQVLGWNGSNIIGTNTLPAVASADATGQTADIGTTTLYAVPASGAGTYRISCYIVLTTPAGTSSTLPQCIGGWTGKDSADIAHTVALTANAQSGNVAGTTGIVTGSFYGVMTVEARASTNITYSTSGYASSPASTMQFAIHVKAEYLGP